MSTFYKLFIPWLILWPIFLLPPLALGQADRGETVIPNLRLLSLKSGYIFEGTVTAVERVPAAGPHNVATTRISFHVDRGIRGVSTGRMLVIREWAGLWSAGERYRTGERVLLFLYAPSKLGLTSPVAGALGRLAISSQGTVVLPPGDLQTFPDNPIRGQRLYDQRGLSSRDVARAIRRAEE